MILFLRALFILIIVSMGLVTSWASMHCALFSIPAEVVKHPWFIATLFDAYWGFICFYLWIAWKEQGLLPRILWFLAVILLGNLAMAAYALRELFRIREASQIPGLLSSRNEPCLLFPSVLSAIAVLIYSLALIA